MNRHPFFPYTWVLFFSVLVVSFSRQIDVFISSLFYNPEQGFFLKDNGFVQFVRKGLPEIMMVLVVLMIIIWIAGRMKKKTYFGISGKITAFIVLSLAIGPGLVVNGIFKELWGRARPSQIGLFGGTSDFTYPWIISDNCESNCSFMSGHAALGFWVFCFALLVPEKYRKRAVCGALAFGIMVGSVRIIQGGHFFSDVFFAAVTTIIITIYLHRLIFKGKE